MGLFDKRDGDTREMPITREMPTRELEVTDDLVLESLRRLELELEDEGWRRIGSESEQEFSRGSLKQLITLSRALYLSNPLIKRAVNVQSYYTWSQGSTIKAADESVQKEIVEPMMSDDWNRAELFSHQACLLTEVDLIVEGNVFIALPTNQEGDVSVRSIPTEQVEEIYTRDGDGRVITFYKRTWGEMSRNEASGEIEIEQKNELYPDWRYLPNEGEQKDTLFGMKVNWDTPIIHQRSGGLKSMKFGIPETYAAWAWARAYKGFLEDWHTLVKSLSKLAWKATTKGKKVRKLKDKFQSTIPDGTSGEGGEDNPPPVTGSMWIGKEGDDIQAIPKSSAHTSAEDSRPSRLMVASATDLPDTILSGDPQQGALATAKTLDRPTELRMKSRQAMAAEFRKDIFRYAVDAKVRKGNFGGQINTDSRTELLVIEPQVDPTVDVSFPPILEHDKGDSVSAIVSAATLDGKLNAGTMPNELVSKLLLEALEVEDIEAQIKELPEPEQAEVAEAVERVREALKGNSGSNTR